MATFEYLWMSYKKRSKNENFISGSVAMKHLTNPSTAGLQLSAESLTLAELISAYNS
jgi:hypothetical protein